MTADPSPDHVGFVLEHRFAVPPGRAPVRSEGHLVDIGCALGAFDAESLAEASGCKVGLTIAALTRGKAQLPVDELVSQVRTAAGGIRSGCSPLLERP